jgi:hypothetical protein
MLNKHKTAKIRGLCSTYVVSEVFAQSEIFLYLLFVFTYVVTEGIDLIPWGKILYPCSTHVIIEVYKSLFLFVFSG